MSCDRCVNQAETAMEAAGVPPGQAQAAWADDGRQPARCPRCGKFLSMRGLCRGRCIYEQYRVEATSVEDFLDRYYKPERFRGRGEEYAVALIASHTADFERDGYDVISRHDSVTRRTVAFFGPAESADTASQAQATGVADDNPQRRDAGAGPAPPARDVTPLFTLDNLIHSYTRTQLIEDGLLVDVTETAKEAGFLCPVAVTVGVWALIEDIPPDNWETPSVQDRLRRVLQWGVRHAQHNRDQSVLLFRVLLRNDDNPFATLKLVAGAGDRGELVVTVMLPDED
jgi:hypothetical protein